MRLSGSPVPQTPQSLAPGLSAPIAALLPASCHGCRQSHACVGHANRVLLASPHLLPGSLSILPHPVPSGLGKILALSVYKCFEFLSEESTRALLYVSCPRGSRRAAVLPAKCLWLVMLRKGCLQPLLGSDLCASRLPCVSGEALQGQLQIGVGSGEAVHLGTIQLAFPVAQKQTLPHFLPSHLTPAPPKPGSAT